MTPEAQRVRDWWTTSIIDIAPGIIRLRGFPVEELIGNRGFVETIWLMLRGELPERRVASLLEAALVAAVDHGPQAPAIAIARMAATCGVDLNGAMASAINVLGDVHGGAGQQCMGLLAAIVARASAGAALADATADELAAWRAANGKFVSGFGHRFHPVDPRAVRLMELVAAAAADGAISGRYRAAGLAVQAELERNGTRQVPMNIDGATAVIFCELGFQPELGRGLFILSRAVGILAHAWEQSRDKARIKGPTPPEFLYRYDGPPKRAVPPRDGA